MSPTVRRFIFKFIIPIALVLCILMSLPLVCGEDHHHHDHPQSDEEPSTFKYSKEANEPYWEDEVQENNHHGHTHDHHEHTHDDHGHSHSSKPRKDDKKTPGNTIPKEKSSVWMDAILSTLLISIAPYLILFCIPVTGSKESEPFLKILLAFASGGLLGDAFLHLIPHALLAQSSTEGGHSHSHSHSHGDGEGHGHDITIGKNVLAGIILFFVVEKFVIIFKGGHTHSHSHEEITEETSKKDKTIKEEKDEKDKTKTDEKEIRKIDEQDEIISDSKHGNQIKVAAYLNLAADFTHNLTDGLAIGASFLAGRSVGIVTTITIFLHEIPHEIGDFAILLKSGCSRTKAMQLQLVTAAGALTGTLISLFAEGSDASTIAWILPFTAGGFIYIATVSVIPDLLKNSNFWQSVAEISALLCGIFLMMGISVLEEMGHDV